MQWRPEFATGDPQIDEPHRTLFASADQFREALDANQGEQTYDLFLQFLAAYAAVHFGVEEECMNVRKCPVAARNKVEHESFLKLVAAESERFSQHGFDHDVAVSLLDRIDNWLSSHICRIDVKLRDAPIAP